MGLTEARVVLRGDFGRKKGGRRHSLLNAVYLIRVVAYQPGCDRVVALLNRTRACNRHIEHGAVIGLEALLLGLVQSVRDRIQLLRLAASTRLLRSLYRNCQPRIQTLTLL